MTGLDKDSRGKSNLMRRRRKTGRDEGWRLKWNAYLAAGREIMKSTKRRHGIFQGKPLI